MHQIHFQMASYCESLYLLMLSFREYLVIGYLSKKRLSRLTWLIGNLRIVITWCFLTRIFIHIYYTDVDDIFQIYALCPHYTILRTNGLKMSHCGVLLPATNMEWLLKITYKIQLPYAKPSQVHGEQIIRSHNQIQIDMIGRFTGVEFHVYVGRLHGHILAYMKVYYLHYFNHVNCIQSSKIPASDTF